MKVTLTATQCWWENLKKLSLTNIAVKASMLLFRREAEAKPVKLSLKRY